MTDDGLPEVSDGHAAPALGSELVASVDSGEPLEVSQLYAGVRRLLDATTSDGRKVGDCRHGVYLFVDYDGEPIYVGQTRADTITLPESVRGTILPVGSRRQREHPDIRLARRARTIADLARVISERRVSPGIRRTLWVQAQRLEFLAKNRLDEFED